MTGPLSCTCVLWTRDELRKSLFVTTTVFGPVSPRLCLPGSPLPSCPVLVGRTGTHPTPRPVRRASSSLYLLIWSVSLVSYMPVFDRVRPPYTLDLVPHCCPSVLPSRLSSRPLGTLGTLPLARNRTPVTRDYFWTELPCPPLSGHDRTCDVLRPDVTGPEVT